MELSKQVIHSINISYTSVITSRDAEQVVHIKSVESIGRDSRVHESEVSIHAVIVEAENQQVSNRKLVESEESATGGRWKCDCPDNWSDSNWAVDENEQFTTAICAFCHEPVLFCGVSQSLLVSRLHRLWDRWAGMICKVVQPSEMLIVSQIV